MPLLIISATVALPDDIFDATAVQSKALAEAKVFADNLSAAVGDGLLEFKAQIKPGSAPTAGEAEAVFATTTEKPVRKRRTKAEIAAAAQAPMTEDVEDAILKSNRAFDNPHHGHDISDEIPGREEENDGTPAGGVAPPWTQA